MRLLQQALKYPNLPFFLPYEAKERSEEIFVADQILIYYNKNSGQL